MSANTRIQQYSDRLYLICLPVPIIGFDGFIGAWVYAGDPLVLVDVGPTVTSSHLLEALAELGLGAPELILLTHIHIDHAGGIGPVAAALPKAKVVCHPKGVPHLIDPERLWQGSVKTLGDIARAYESIEPVAGEQVVAMDQLDHPLIQCIETPGHAAHHVSFMIGDMLFAGEAGGVCLEVPDKTTYLRPATPPRFFLETSLKSIDRLIAQSPKKICYGHIGKRNDAVKMLQKHRRQLLHWLDLIRPFHEKANEQSAAAMQRACAEHLLTEDPLLKGFPNFSKDVQARERSFLSNSIKGYWGYLQGQDDQRFAANRK
jgi:glyoxylase-like metal-dependent hydrolase (beta-lactamase superfamily II)